MDYRCLLTFIFVVERLRHQWGQDRLLVRVHIDSGLGWVRYVGEVGDVCVFVLELWHGNLFILIRMDPARW